MCILALNDLPRGVERAGSATLARLTRPKPRVALGDLFFFSFSKNSASSSPRPSHPGGAYRYTIDMDVNPYEADPDKIPPEDYYADVPLYGRYYPKPDDFQPDPAHINSTSAESLDYWASVLALCDASVRIYDDQEGGRDVFALGGVIIKSGHLNAHDKGRRASRDYSYADANEVEATELARKLLKDMRVPKIYFAGKVCANSLLTPHYYVFCG